ncbi:hypothetical protein M9H77_20711 [Catharanthus roseus]|uniref:Uncharacterized protein n=1 Tax=Catharanthus roseus TaxID=4058 RepID=A0ACC0APN2_CATRO|nr:hypothetical protein M9H77_20711 [Catharanthus roseus]
MATRRTRCQWCGVPLHVPYEARRIHCPNCRRIVQLPEVNGNLNGGMRISPYVGYQRPGPRMPIQMPQLPVHGPKRAVLCGVSYKNHPKSLKGSINDVQSMRHLLVERLGFPSSSVLVLTEEEKGHTRIPTKRNIRAALQWLVQGCQARDSLLFYYSGHGSRVRDRDWDEIDEHDEALCPVDFETEGKILDDEINATIVRPLTRGVTLHAIFDTCFSGTSLDLRYVCRMNREGNYKWEDHFVPYAEYKGTAGGLAISISACDDHQNSQDTTYFTGTATGALTYTFIKTLEYEPRLTYGRLFMTMRDSIYKAQSGSGPNGAFPTNDSLQEPLLSTSTPFDIHQKPFIL